MQHNVSVCEARHSLADKNGKNISKLIINKFKAVLIYLKKIKLLFTKTLQSINKTNVQLVTKLSCGRDLAILSINGRPHQSTVTW